MVSRLRTFSRYWTLAVGRFPLSLLPERSLRAPGVLLSIDLPFLGSVTIGGDSDLAPSAF